MCIMYNSSWKFAIINQATEIRQEIANSIFAKFKCAHMSVAGSRRFYLNVIQVSEHTTQLSGPENLYLINVVTMDVFSG